MVDSFFNTGLFKVFEPKYKDLIGEPHVSVSSKGISNGLSSIANNGMDFGPDTTLNATSPNQVGPPYSKTKGMNEIINYVVANGIANPSIIDDAVYTYSTPSGIVAPVVYLPIIMDGGKYIIDEPINISSSRNIIIEGNGSLITPSSTFPLSGNGLIMANNTWIYGLRISNIYINANGASYGMYLNNVTSSGGNNTFNNIIIDNFITAGIYNSYMSGGGFYNINTIHTNPNLNAPQYSIQFNDPNDDERMFNCSLHAGMLGGTAQSLHIYGGVISGYNVNGAISAHGVFFYSYDYNGTIYGPIVSSSYGVYQGCWFDNTNNGPHTFIPNLLPSDTLTLTGCNFLVGNNVTNPGSVFGNNIGGANGLIIIEGGEIGIGSNSSGTLYWTAGNTFFKFITLPQINLPSGITFNFNPNYASPSIPTNPPVSGAVYQNTNGIDIRLKIPVTYNPTSTTAATLATGTSMSSTVTTTTKVSYPAGLATGFIDTYEMVVPANGYFEIEVTNATLSTVEVEIT